MIVDKSFWDGPLGRVFRGCTVSVALNDQFELRKEDRGFAQWYLYRRLGKTDNLEHVIRRDLKDGISVFVSFSQKEDGERFIEEIKAKNVPFVFPDTIYGGLSDG